MYGKNTKVTIYILLALLNKELSGYDLIGEVKAISQGEITLLTGSLYPKLKRLTELEYIEIAEERLTGRQKTTYRITEKGTQALLDDMKKIETLLGQMKRRLGES
ncbi:PadR family transcriptional regulator [Maledivibacter halophilus]|uniref:DNA-binding transcriptional regulator, PadR family n=1 Tax=Maledivibacter halophilus TaxID=36842 RepID=A0A1T5LNZ8_9FIRM|nr:PadR family transcriptional regulator [Maledivibacter halophilus]SKC77631.1 DNA-binding transcriptional regulator, PadR family [Maledivibacter halophilus]